MLLGVCLLLPLAALGHQYPPVPYHPLHPHFPPLPPDPPLHPPGPPGRPHFGSFPLRDQSHAHPSLLPPPPLRAGTPGPGGVPVDTPAGAAAPPPGSPNRPTMPHRPPQWSSVLGYQRPMDDMVDITNELGVAVLQDYAYSRGNFAFSPYGVASVLVVLYEGARGETARQVHTTLKLPWDRDVLRVGFRDIHRNLRSYFTHEGYLSGVTLSQSRSALIPEFRRVLRFYGYDVDTPPEGFNYSDSAATKPGDKPGDKPGPAITITSDQITSHKQTGSNGTSATNGTSESSTSSPVHSSTKPSSTARPSPTTTAKPSPSTTTTPVISTTLTGSTEAPVSEGGQQSTDSSPTTSATSEAAVSTTPLTVPDAENEVERISTDGPLSLLNPSLMQHKFPGILMGSRLQEQLNSLFPEGLPESRGDDLELPPQPTAASTSVTMTTTTTSTTTTATDFTTESQPQDSSTIPPPPPEDTPEVADPEPVSESMETTESSESTGPTDAPESTAQPSESTTAESSTQPTTWATNQPTTQSNTAASGELVSATEADEVAESQGDVDSDPGSSPEPEPETSTPEVSTTSPLTTEAPSSTASSASTSSPAAPAVVQRRARLPGPALSFWTGLEAASAHNASKTRSRRELNGGLPDLSLQLQNGMFDSHVATGDELFTQLPRQPFLVDGSFEEPVPVMEYTSSFPFAYIPRLHALALEFPLDDERYRLLLLLPVERQGLRQLLHGLGRVSLRDVQRALRPTRVHAVVPAFMVEGFVILTPTLQQLGIWDIFDPRRADLSGMTDDPDLYVRNIEQAVTVVVKNYVEILDIQTRTTAARSRLDQFVATHPFLYFVMDAETQVSLMAGKVVDPLNSRIY